MTPAGSPAQAARTRRAPLTLQIVALACAGALQSLAFVHTWAWWLPLLSTSLLAFLVARSTPARAALLGWSLGTAWLLAGTWWLYISLHRYGGLPGWLAALAVFVLCAFLSLYMAAAMAAFVRFRSGRAGLDALWFGALWLLAELARGVIYTGFPWLASGYAQVDGPLAMLAPWLGVYGIGFVVAALAAWPVLAGCSGIAHGRGRRAGLAALGVAGLLLAAAWWGPRAYSAPAGALEVSLLQSNVAQDEKFSIERLPAALEWASAQLQAARGDLVVAPETIIPLLPAQLDPAYWQALTRHFQQPGRAALIGLPLGDEARGYTNSAAGISAATRALPDGHYRYDKHHLVPFGEFVPPGFRWFTRLMNIPLGDFNRGSVGAPSFAVGAQRVAPNICYEDLFGEELAARYRDPQGAPTVYANISNIGWFGQTIAIDQHLQISRMRTLEFQRPMLRATNTGATAVIDHRGVVTHLLEPGTRGVLQATVQGRSGVTPFAWWASRAGLWPLVAVALLVALALSAQRRRARKR